MLLGVRSATCGFNYDFGIEGRDFAGGGDGLGQGFCGVVLIEQRLPLQIAGLNVIAVDNADRAHAGAGQQGSQGRAGGAAAYNGRAGRRQLALAFSADSAEQHLPRIAFRIQETAIQQLAGRFAFREVRLCITRLWLLCQRDHQSCAAKPLL